MNGRRDLPPSDRDPRISPWNLTDTLLLAAVTVIAAWTRLAGLTYPRRLVFDETYYAKDACWYFEATARVCETRQTEAHPPLGKWLIGTGIEIFGFEPLGWRIMPALAGIVTVILVYVLMRVLTRSRLAAGLAAAFLAIDLLHIVQSRTSMLDIFLPLFGVAAVLFVTLDKDWSGGSFRPWRVAAGAAAGAAVATKWSGIFVLATAAALVIIWSRHRDRGERSAVAGFGSIALCFIVIPVIVYVASYAGRLDGTLLALPWSEGSWIGTFFDDHQRMFDYHRDMEVTHGYQSPPYTWLLLKRPVAYFFETAPNDDYREILATGNPFVWWPSLAALIFVAVDWVRSRRPAAMAIVAGFGFAYVPWLLLGLISDRSATFLFYLVPAVPFMGMALAYVAWRVADEWEGRVAIAVFGAAALASFVFFRPLLDGTPLAYVDWRQRMCLAPEGSDRCLFAHPDSCEKPKGRVTTVTNTVTVSGTPSVSTSEENSNVSLPPKGWCWA